MKSKTPPKHTKSDLTQMQSLPLEAKIQMTKRRIKEWYEYWDGQVCISFSGGKDSTVLKHIVDSMYDDVPAVFFNTGLEYPEIQQFVKEVQSGKYACFNSNVEIMRPAMRFDEVIKKYGYPVGSKQTASNIEYGKRARDKGDLSKYAKYVFGTRKKDGKEYTFGKVPTALLPLVDSDIKVSAHCCYVMKKRTDHAFHSKTGRSPFIATMASESKLRENGWLKTGCNAFDGAYPSSKPLSFWTEQDILHYIKQFDVPYCPVYGEIRVKHTDQADGQMSFDDEIAQDDTLELTGLQRTGCMFCMFGAHLEKEPNRFQRMKQTHPNQYAYCMKPVEEGGLGLAKVLDFIGVKY